MSDEPKVEPPTTKLRPVDTFRILLLDSIEHTNQMKDASKEAGHSVVAAHTIKEAIAFLDDIDHADVIVCAAHLEEESLFDFLDQLRKNPVHKNCSFMILSLEPGPAAERTELSTKRAGLLLGANAFVTMPVFDPIQLIVEIKKLLPPIPALVEEKLENQGQT